MAEVNVHTSNDPKTLGLLHEWFVYWAVNPELSEKLPNALHVRTALALEEAGYDVRKILGGGDG